MKHLVSDFRLDGMALRYSQFVPKLYNYCLSLGFRPARIMPSRAFCSDESQGYPVILLARHFGVFPFDHGEVGGRVAVDRHKPHSDHGEDLVIVHASHVGYDAEGKVFGVYRRPRTDERGFGSNCGKLSAVLAWYQREYAHAQSAVHLGRLDGEAVVYIDNALLDPDREEGLYLALDRLVQAPSSGALRALSTAKAFRAADDLLADFGAEAFASERAPLGDRLGPELFHFRRAAPQEGAGRDYLAEAIAPAMPWLVCSKTPVLDAARYHTQVEFDRTYRTLQREPAYAGKNLLFISGLNIDVSPSLERLFPMTKFIPWAAYGRLRDGREFILEQDALFAALAAQSALNPDEIAFDAAIQAMANAEGVEFPAV